MAQKTILEIIKAVANESALPVPPVVTTSNDGNHLRMLAFAKAVCDDLLDEFDWQELQRHSTFTTTEGVTDYALPTDYARFLNGTFYDQSRSWPINGSFGGPSWQNLYSTSPFNGLRFTGNKLQVHPAPTNTPVTFSFDYMSSFYVWDNGASMFKGDITKDDDVICFDHRLMVYGIKLKLAAFDGQETSGPLFEYLKRLSAAKAGNSPAERISLIPRRGIHMIGLDNIPDSGWGR